MLNYKITILDNNPDAVPILQEYWRIENNKFLNKVPDLQKKFQVSKNHLTNIVKSLSYCDVQLENCTVCNELRSERVTTRSGFIDILNCYHLCKDCSRKEDIAFRQKTDLENEKWEEKNNIHVKNEIEDQSELEFLLSKEIDKSDNFQVDFKGTYIHLHIDPKDKIKYTLRTSMDRGGTITISLTPLETDEYFELDYDRY